MCHPASVSGSYLYEEEMRETGILPQFQKNKIQRYSGSRVFVLKVFQSDCFHRTDLYIEINFIFL